MKFPNGLSLLALLYVPNGLSFENAQDLQILELMNALQFCAAWRRSVHLSHQAHQGRVNTLSELYSYACGSSLTWLLVPSVALTNAVIAIRMMN